MAGFVSRQLNRWIDKRLPPRHSVRLNRTNIFIFPSKAGFSFLFMICLLWLIGINYENNLVLALTFLLISLFVVSILHTYSNLAGLQVTAVRTKPVVAGENAPFELLLQRNNERVYENLLLSWNNMPPQIVNLTDTAQQKVTLYLQSRQRGWLNPGRLWVRTYYPLGLLRAWTRLDLKMACLIYPKPEAAGPLPFSQSGQGEGGMSYRSGAEDFYGLKAYQKGDSLRHVAWKQFARGQGLHTKEYASEVDRKLWLDWDYLAGLSRESRLSRLCYWVLKAEQTEFEYGLRLPGMEIQPSRGQQHRDHLLKIMALFELNNLNGPSEP